MLLITSARDIFTGKEVGGGEAAVELLEVSVLSSQQIPLNSCMLY